MGQSKPGALGGGFPNIMTTGGMQIGSDPSLSLG